MEQYKVAVIGAGPGGYETAIRLNQLNISTICFEKEKLGGVCLNKGCIPTKTLVKVADTYHEMKNASEIGLENINFDIDYKKIYERKKQVVEKLVTGIEFLFKKRQIPLIQKTVIKIEKQSQIYKIYTEDAQIYTAEYLIIATGSQPKELPFLKYDTERTM